MKRLLAAAALAAIAACGDQTATQYVGTVMNEASPEVEGTLRLTLFSRTDTSFTGIMELGPPAVGTGSAFAWHEGSELRIVTVAGTGSDTILWTSKLTDEGLGGRFEVTGGERAGQGGTWRARHTKGPPASPATLRLPQSVALPPASATWPLALLLLATLWLGRWIRRAPAPIVVDAAAEGQLGLARFRPSLSGISGWLALFLIGQIVGFIVVLARIGAALTEYAEGIGVGAAIAGLQPLILFELAVQLLTPPLALTGIILIIRRSRYAPRYWYAILVSSAVVLAIDLMLGAYMSSEMTRLLGATYMEETVKDSGNADMIRQLVMSLVWALYWVRSERVRATFGAAALDSVAHAVPGAHAVSVAHPVPVASAPAEPAVAAPSPWRRRRRIALRVAAGVVGLVIAVFAIGLWQTRVHPYSVSPGVDIRKTVAGRWAWTTTKDGCADPHTIAFSDDGKVMTIVQSTTDVAVDQATTTYDIEHVTPSSIRGAIRGEDRLTDDGKPVVWDLVLVGPDEYRWRRTDWSSSWGYTAKIVRCTADRVTESPTR